MDVCEIKDYSQSFVDLFADDAGTVPCVPLFEELPLLSAHQTNSNDQSPFSDLFTSTMINTEVRNERVVAVPSSIQQKKLPLLANLSDHELQEVIEQHFVDVSPKKSDQMPDLYLRWLEAPPDRVHATSPSKLGSQPKPGGSFSFSVQLVTCTENVFMPYSATEDLVLTANVYGKSKSDKKTELDSSSLVLLENNPIGKPLMISESGLSCVVTAVLSKGESVATFKSVSLTCGSNPARSVNAPKAARIWDWDYYLRVNAQKSGVIVRPLFSKHITTDSNRSQTREKRKRPDDSDVLPPSKRSAHFPIAPNFGIFQPYPVQCSQTYATFSAFPPMQSTKLKL